MYILFKVAALILIGNLKYKVYTLVRVSRAEEIHIYVVRGFFGKKDWSARGWRSEGDDGDSQKPKFLQLIISWNEDVKFSAPY